MCSGLGGWGRGGQRQEPGNDCPNSKFWWPEAHEFQYAATWTGMSNCSCLMIWDRKEPQRISLRGSCHLPTMKDGECMETIPRHQQKKTHIYCTRCSTWLFTSFLSYSVLTTALHDIIIPILQMRSSERLSNLLQALQLPSTVNRVWAQGIVCLQAQGSVQHTMTRAIQNPAAEVVQKKHQHRTRRGFSG